MAIPNKIVISNPVLNGTIRKNDKWGQGHFGAPRGSRKHNGIDITTQLGTPILSPIEGKVIRVAYPYASDMSFTGLLIKGTGAHQGLEVKIFYMKPTSNIVNKAVKPGQQIGTSQSLLNKYPGITNHIHIEIKLNGIKQNPKSLIKNIF